MEQKWVSTYYVSSTVHVVLLVAGLFLTALVEIACTQELRLFDERRARKSEGQALSQRQLREVRRKHCLFTKRGV